MSSFYLFNNSLSPGSALSMLLDIEPSIGSLGNLPAVTSPKKTHPPSRPQEPSNASSSPPRGRALWPRLHLCWTVNWLDLVWRHPQCVSAATFSFPEDTVLQLSSFIIWFLQPFCPLLLRVPWAWSERVWCVLYGENLNPSGMQSCSGSDPPTWRQITQSPVGHRSPLNPGQCCT